MASIQVPLQGNSEPNAEPVILPPIGVSLPPDFNMQTLDERLQSAITDEPVSPPLGVLEHFKGAWSGTGFNQIFRPKHVKAKIDFPNKIIPVRDLPDDSVLQLSLTTETLVFSKPLGDVPNRGLGDQPDISLNGVNYTQVVADVTNDKTGRPDKAPLEIHFEPGLWMHIPPTAIPRKGASLSRMASIPHGTVINAQVVDPADDEVFKGTVTSGAPTIPKTSITPFLIRSPDQKFEFDSQTAENQNTSRIPQDLSKFLETGLLTTKIINNPNLILEEINKTKNIIETIEFKVNTRPLDTGGIANIDFLEGVTNAGNPNADASHVEATFWIEKVKHKIEVQPWKVGDPPQFLSPIDTAPGVLAPLFKVQPDREITAPKIIDVIATHIQYSQKVLLDFNGLSWPHISVATLVPRPSDESAILVPNSALD